MTDKQTAKQTDDIFVPYGQYEDLKRVYEQPLFFNAMVSGPKGCGKTQSILHIHEDLGLDIMRVNITIESDEDSLMGGFRLKDGATYFDKGPVVMAMERGCTLLLDECDLGHPMKLLCLQSVLEGKGYLIKKTGEWIAPKEGFKVVMTANTKGAGDTSGGYIGTQILNGAMLDRIDAFFTWDYPDTKTEKTIVKKLADHIGVHIDEKVIDVLIRWARQIRDEGKGSFESTETISTRKLCSIVKATKIYQNIDKAVLFCINGYTADRIFAYKELFEKMKPLDDAKVNANKAKFKNHFDPGNFATV